MVSSLFITLGRPIIVGGVLYNYEDNIYNHNCKITSTNVTNSTNATNTTNATNSTNVINTSSTSDSKLITNILTEGQRCSKMDYCIRKDMHIFIRFNRVREFVYMGTANFVETIREWSDTKPALYHIEIKTTDIPDPICKKTPEMILYKTNYKIAAFVHIGLSIPVKCSLDSGIFDHDPDYNPKDHKMKRTRIYFDNKRAKQNIQKDC